MDRVRREPLGIAGAVILLTQVIMAWVMAMGWLNWSSEQLISFDNMVIACVELSVLIVTLYMARQRVTPISSPRTADGDPARLIEKHQ